MFIELDILIAKPLRGNPIIVASFATDINFSYLFSDHSAPFLEYEIRSSKISSLGAFKTASGVGYALKIARELLEVTFENTVL